jgi:uncharacterized phiE125 gp8 family phage protein
MWGPVVVTVEPTDEPVTLDEAKVQVEYDADDRDDLIESLIAVARQHVERMTGLRFVTQTVRFKTDDWADLEALPAAPLSAITGITYTDPEGASQTLATSVYEARLDGIDPSIVLKFNQSWPGIRLGSQIVVTATAGYGAASAVPDPIVHAIKMIVADLFHRREPGAAETETIDNLLCNYRRHLIQ